MQKSLMEKCALSSMIEKINNKTIPDYLEQISSWIEDYAVSLANDIAWENVDFQILARMLYMGKIYE